MRALLAIAFGLAAALIYSRARAAQAPDFYGAIPSGDIIDTGTQPGDLAPITDTVSAQNITAFLRMIRAAESGDNYSALVGGGNLTDFSDHPANKGWPGIRTTDGRKSTAAGAYQITQTTWNSEIQPALALPDFSPASQDQAAVYILQVKRPGAYAMIVNGKFSDAIARLRQEWEAFDKMLSGTYNMTLAQAEAIYTQAGGMVT